MKSLKEYIDIQNLSGLHDIEIIVAYFIDNDMEEQAMEVCHSLAKAKIEKIKNSMFTIKSWAYTIPSDYLYKKYPEFNEVRKNIICSKI